MKLLQRFGKLLFPPKCILCGKVLEKDETDLCRHCRIDSPECGGSARRLPFISHWAAVWYYEGLARKSILRYKFRGARGYAPIYGRLLAMALQRQQTQNFDLLTWVPTGRWRKLRRGYDQVELLAKAVGQELGVEPVSLLKKVRNNPPQSGIVGDAQRRANVLGAYRVKNPETLAGKRILLLDDVVTTGATIGEAARVLLIAGAEEVYCGAVAMVRRSGK